MKQLKELSKQELLGLIYNNLFSTKTDGSDICECACCGQTSNAKYYYECDECFEIFKKEREDELKEDLK